ncbi:MAG TPA: hypothetical protein VKS22_04285 [Candidatus Binataceae bacterium]|nr:hypothetical protein [Candidatus Binataceae bacterium]
MMQDWKTQQTEITKRFATMLDAIDRMRPMVDRIGERLAALDLASMSNQTRQQMKLFDDSAEVIVSSGRSTWRRSKRSCG